MNIQVAKREKAQYHLYTGEILDLAVLHSEQRGKMLGRLSVSGTENDCMKGDLWF